MHLFWSVFFLVPQLFLISTSGVEMTCKRVVFFKVWSYACVWACTHTAHVTRKVALGQRDHLWRRYVTPLASCGLRYERNCLPVPMEATSQTAKPRFTLSMYEKVVVSTQLQ